MNHINIALQQIGIKEDNGTADNLEVLKYFEGTALANPHDQISWCSAFVNWVCKQANLPHTNSLVAKSWLKIGKPVVLPKLGDIVILWREDKQSWKGHVGFFIAERGDKVYILGGNQSDMVCIAPYKIEQVLGYRRLII